MDYKSTLNLPKTAFPMKGNLPQSEPKLLERWEAQRLYSAILERRKGAAPFILHDGPPYANGDIHIGHALNKVLKDVIVRYRGMRGSKAPYVPGWDCHGLPIEYALMKELKVTKHQVDIVDFRRKARAYARKYVGIQREQFKRLGVGGDWDHPYLTLEPGYVEAALRVLSALARKGFITRARKPVNWCWSCETALAEAEVEYETHTSPSIFVKFELTAGGSAALAGKFPALKGMKLYFVIWTTTPWTLMGNVAVAVHPRHLYGIWQKEKAPGEGWIALASPPPGAKEVVAEEARVVAQMEGSALEGLAYRHPFGLREGKVVPADYVSMGEGTGLVHTAPGFGAEDYATGRKYGLETLAPVDPQGRFTGLPAEVADLNGRQVQQANPAVVEKLRQADLLLKEGRIEHEYPHCWRCREPIIFRATDQWFLNVGHEELRRKLLEVIEEVRWIPPEGKERIAGMVKSRPDWCLSRQRLWGIPIPAVTCAGCGEGILDPGVIETFASAIESDPEGSDRWFSEPVTRWLPDSFSCSGCGGKQFKPGADILDVWFDSGVSHQGVLARREDHSVPADLYLEGSDQHRGWFQVSLITAVALEGKAPYRGVLTHGFVVDGEGRKMSKSLGNVIAPQEVISSLGADVLRLWVASSDYREDIRLSPTILSQVSEVYRKIRNTLRFLLANLSDLPAAEMPAAAGMTEMNRWMLIRLDDLIREVTDAYEKYAFHRAVKAIHEFCTVRLSNFYLDLIKDRLYTAPPGDPRRREIQTVLAILADRLIRLMAPILPFTAEEAWGALPFNEGQSVHLQDWPRVTETSREESVLDAWSRLLELRDEVMKELEKGREGGQIGDSLEARVILAVREPSLWKLLEPRREAFESACIVSELLLERAEGPGPAAEIRVERAPGSKCRRCWMRLPSVGVCPEHPQLCHRCVEAVKLWYTPGLR